MAFDPETVEYFTPNLNLPVPKDGAYNWHAVLQDVIDKVDAHVLNNYVTINEVIVTDEVVAGNWQFEKTLRVGLNGLGDSSIEFYDDNNNVWRTFGWSSVFDQWVIEDITGSEHFVWHSGLIVFGDAASKDTGTIAGTVAAGDHTHPSPGGIEILPDPVLVASFNGAVAWTTVSSGEAFDILSANNAKAAIFRAYVEVTADQTDQYATGGGTLYIRRKGSTLTLETRRARGWASQDNSLDLNRAIDFSECTVALNAAYEFEYQTTVSSQCTIISDIRLVGYIY